MMDFAFHHAWRVEEEKFGNAILSRLPMKVIQKQGLHHHKADRSRRSALWVEIELAEQLSMQIINTHLSIYPKEQRIQAAELIDDWYQRAVESGPVILCGDFNARPGTRTYQEFARLLRDVEPAARKFNRSTYFSPFPFSRVDHIFHGPAVTSREVHIVKTRLARLASDHLPLVAELEIRPDGRTPDSI
jgi:endonuclease/exonuclease/phosphatase family metal-dependent hydrolase